MLDDLKFIHQRDASDALGIAAKQWQQLEHDFEFEVPKFDVANIVYAGMGGSALAARLSVTWPGYHVPFEVCSQYKVPGYVSSRTLFVASSYSGDTEEVLSALEDARGRGAHIVVIASGGKLREIAEQSDYPFILLPEVGQPRYSVLYALKALVVLLEKVGLVKVSEASAEIARTAQFLKSATDQWLPTVPQASNPAKALALEIMGKSAVIYGGPLMYPAAYKWKISMNENAKNIAWCNQLSEFDHNEIMGWTSHPVDKPYTVIELRSKLEHPRIQKRFEVGERVLSGKRPAAEVIEVQGDSLLEQLLWSVVYGDFVSLYLALLNGLDPSPVELLQKFKKLLVD